AGGAVAAVTGPVVVVATAPLADEVVVVVMPTVGTGFNEPDVSFLALPLPPPPQPPTRIRAAAAVRIGFNRRMPAVRAPAQKGLLSRWRRRALAGRGPSPWPRRRA